MCSARVSDASPASVVANAMQTGEPGTQQRRDVDVDPLQYYLLVLNVISVTIQVHKKPKANPPKLAYFILNRRRSKCMKDVGCPYVRICTDEFFNKVKESIGLRPEIYVNRQRYVWDDCTHQVVGSKIKRNCFCPIGSFAPRTSPGSSRQTITGRSCNASDPRCCKRCFQINRILQQHHRSL